MTKEKYTPPQTIIMDKQTLSFQHSSDKNIEGERLSEECFYYRSSSVGKLVPFVKGQLDILSKS